MTETKMNVYQKISIGREKLQRMPLKKSGLNKYAGFKYFELSDFLPAINSIFAVLGLMSQFKIIEEPDTVDEDGVITKGYTTATLTIYNTDMPSDKVIFSSPVAAAGMKGATPIQELGSQHTYMRRYLWLEAMEISESDGVDATAGSDSQKEPQKQARKPVADKKPAPEDNVPKTAGNGLNIPCTAKQIEIINSLAGDSLGNMLQHYGVEAVQDMTVAQAAEAIKILQMKRG